jgi:hypothetical protein
LLTEVAAFDFHCSCAGHVVRPVTMFFVVSRRLRRFPLENLFDSPQHSLLDELFFCCFDNFFVPRPRVDIPPASSSSLERMQKPINFNDVLDHSPPPPRLFFRSIPEGNEMLKRKKMLNQRQTKATTKGKEEIIDELLKLPDYSFAFEPTSGWRSSLSTHAIRHEMI